MSEILSAPWNDDQVMSLNACQTCKWHLWSKRPRARWCASCPGSYAAGWTRPKCTARGKRYVQTFCHDFMADWSWNHEPL